MVCIYCGHKTEVVNSRLNKKLNRIWRRRSCVSCGNVFSTYEEADRAKSWRVQSGHKLAEFQRDRLLISLYKSLAHRSAAAADASALTDTVISLLAKQPDGSIDRQILAHEAHIVLKRFDIAAATHYAAFHATVLN